MVIINFLDGRKFLSNPLTVGTHKKLSRYGRETLKAAIKADEVKNSDPATTENDRIIQYDSMMGKLEVMLEARDNLIISAFGGQFRVDEYEDNVTTEEAARVISELQGIGSAIIEKNV